MTDRLSKDEQRALLEHIEAGETDAKIRDMMWISQTQINQEKKILREMFLLDYKQRGQPKTVISKELQDKILSLSKEGKTNEYISKSLNVSTQTLYKYKKLIRSKGIDIPTLSGRPKTPKKCPHCGLDL